MKAIWRQAEDLFAVMNHFGVEVAHLMGHCGGAVIALMAASSRPMRVASISLIMDTDMSCVFSKVVHSTLIVTSEEDNTAHPAGSRIAAEKLRNAILHVEPRGDHMSFFDAEPKITELAVRFISGEMLSGMGNLSQQ
jgi:pimeloyl-ACP methyl ester carboxylesterase